MDGEKYKSVMGEGGVWWGRGVEGDGGWCVLSIGGV